MPKVRVIGPVDDETRDKLLRLLAEAGLEVLDDGSVEADGPSADVCVLDVDRVEAVVAGRSAGDDPGLAPADAAPPVEEPRPEAAVPPPGHPDGCEEDVGIVVLSPACLEGGAIAGAMQDAAARGCHVIGIWPPGAPEASLPGPFEDYGGDIVVWDPGRLRDAVVSRPVWSLPDDRPRPERPMKRNRC